MLTLEEAADFHGHLGPFLTIGYLAGEIAREVLKPEGIHDLRAIVNVPLKTPFSCIIDGVQCSSGCTLGKLNIEVKDSEQPFIVFESRDGRRVELQVKGEVVEKCLKLDMEEAVRWLLSLKREDIFEVSTQLG
ncbi:MAG: formylmethanofuran dehydrogenase [Thermoproteota archaeon]|nr:MAG: formylmethanofuran dehydrogenase [Candidatus Korarchaeota archaeon]